MRGSPPLHLVIFIIGFGLLAVPLGKLTFARTAPRPVAQTESKPGTTHTYITLRFAHVPKTVSLMHQGVELIPAASMTQPAGRMSLDADLPLSNGALELVPEVSWPEGTPDTAVTIDLEPDEMPIQSQTRWSRKAKLGGAIKYEWKP